MNSDNILTNTAARLFEDLAPASTLAASETGTWSDLLWGALENHGMTHAAVPEALGGAGADLIDAFDLLTVGGSYSVPLPLAETFLAGWLLAGAGMKVPRGPLSIVPASAAGLILNRDGEAWRLSGTATRVPWGRHAHYIVMLLRDEERDYVACVPHSACVFSYGENLAGEPRDDISVSTLSLSDAQLSVAGAGMNQDALKLMGACARACQMAGALDRILHLAIGYVGERVQFGRPLAKFQAIQHQLAILAGEVAAAGVAADAAARVIQQHGLAQAELEIAAAKLRTGEAAGNGAAIVHQVHGAMGFTQEYPLHYATRRLWSWRDEFGNESYWAERLGAMLLARGGDVLWLDLTARAGIAPPD